MGWQDQYAVKDWQSKLTQLSPQEEMQFRAWWAKQGKGQPLTDDYDMRGFWKFGGNTGVSAVDGMTHYTDTYKTPLHKSFSRESQYVDPKRKDLAPYWIENVLTNPMNGAAVFDEPKEVRKQKLARALVKAKR